MNDVWPFRNAHDRPSGVDGLVPLGQVWHRSVAPEHHWRPERPVRAGWRGNLANPPSSPLLGTSQNRRGPGCSLDLGPGPDLGALSYFPGLASPSLRRRDTVLTIPALRAVVDIAGETAAAVVSSS